MGAQCSAMAPPSQYKTTIIPYKIAEGEVYVGEWKFGKRCGRGTVRVKEQLIYEGEFMNDKRDGHGTGYLKNGNFLVCCSFPCHCPCPPCPTRLLSWPQDRSLLLGLANPESGQRAPKPFLPFAPRGVIFVRFGGLLS